MGNKRDQRKGGDEVGKGTKKRYPLRNYQIHSPNESGELDETINDQAQIVEDRRRSLFVTQRSSPNRVDDGSPQILSRIEQTREHQPSQNSPTNGRLRVAQSRENLDVENNPRDRRFNMNRSLNESYRESHRRAPGVDFEWPREPRVQPNINDLHQRTRANERRMQQQAEQLRNLDEVCDRLSRLHTQIMAERIRQGERITAHQEIVEVRTLTCRRELEQLEENFQELGGRVESNTDHIRRITQTQGTSAQQLLDMRRDLNRVAGRRNSGQVHNVRPALNCPHFHPNLMKNLYNF